MLSYRSFWIYPIGIKTQQVGAHKPGFATSKRSIVKRRKQEKKQVHFSLFREQLYVERGDNIKFTFTVNEKY